MIPSQHHQISGYSQNEVETLEQDVLSYEVALPAKKCFQEMLEVLMKLHIVTENCSPEHLCSFPLRTDGSEEPGLGYF